MLKVSRRHWGRHQEKDIFVFTLESEGITVAVSNYGAILQSFLVEDVRGERLDIVLGYDSFGEYLADRNYFGAMIGPIADRLAEGRCTIADKVVKLPHNAGPDSMHSGPGGFHSRVWEWEVLPDGVVFHLDFPDMALGFPGELKASLAYQIICPSTLRLEYRASCSMETALSFTNHSYFNLDGARRDCLDHTLKLFSDSYAQTTCEMEPLVTGRFLEVQDTPLDFRAGVRMGDALSRIENPEISSADGIDHYFPIGGSGLREAAILSSRQSGLMLSCRSDADGILVYTANGLSGTVGKSMMNYGKNWGICLETGQMPNGVNFQEHRARVLLVSGREYRSKTDFTLDATNPAGD